MIVGVVLTIFSSMTVDGEDRLRISVANWYVDPAFRGYAAMLTSRLRTFKQATYLDITPALHTWPMLETLGYRRFCNGGFFALAALSGRSATATVRRVSSDVEPGAGLRPFEAEILRSHVRASAVSAWSANGSSGGIRSFSCLSRIPPHGIPMPYAQLVYCRDFESYVQLAGPLGRFLLWRGFPLILSDANGPVPGLMGRYVDWGVKFSRGPHPPHFGDLAYTEWAMFGRDAFKT